MSDTEYMKLAIKLAKKGAGYVNPNPMVGAVIVKDNRIIGQGYHEIFGGLHAERNALKNCRESPVGATLYVTLEPCCHYGKTPPCTEAIAQISLNTETPVMFGVLTTDTIEQAIERAGSKAGNKGSECAQGAIEMVNLIRALEV